MFETPVIIKLKSGRIKHGVMSAVNDPEKIYMIDFNKIEEYRNTSNKELIEMIFAQNIFYIDTLLK